MSDQLDISQFNLDRLHQALNECLIFTLRDTSQIQDERHARIQEKLTKAISDYYTFQMYDIYIPDNSIEMHIYEAPKLLIDILNTVIEYAVPAVTYAHEIVLSDESLQRLLAKLYRRKRALFKNDNYRYFGKLEPLSRKHRTATLKAHLEHKVSTLQIKCTEVPGSGNLPHRSPAAYIEQSNTVYLSTLTRFVNLSRDLRSPYAVKAEFMRDLAVQSFLHEMAHVIEPCLFEEAYVKEVIGPYLHIRPQAMQQYTDYINIGLHSIRFKLALLYISEKCIVPSANVRSSFFEKIEQRVIASPRFMYDRIDRTPKFYQFLSRLLGIIDPIIISVPSNVTVSDYIYKWENDIWDAIQDITNQKNIDPTQLIGVRSSEAISEELFNTSNLRSFARPNYAKTKYSTQVASILDDDEFVITYKGQPNLYLADSSKSPTEIFEEIATQFEIIPLDSVIIDSVGIYIISDGQGYEFVFIQKGFDPITLSMEEAWWCLL